MREVTRKKRKNDGALRFKTPHPVPRCRILHIYFSTMNKQTADVFMGKYVCFSALQSGEEGDGDGDEEGDDKGTPKNRKKIRKIIKDDLLRTETRDALKEEEERRKRIAERERLREKLREVQI